MSTVPCTSEAPPLIQSARKPPASASTLQTTSALADRIVVMGRSVTPPRISVSAGATKARPGATKARPGATNVGYNNVPCKITQATLK
jgi:hypothetical protein